MTSLNSLGRADPEPAEVSDASLAMADYDAKTGDYATALEWLAVAAQFRGLTPEYLRKKDRWELSLRTCDAAASAKELAGARGFAPRRRRGCGAGY
jgi:hypothetical protein